MRRIRIVKSVPFLVLILALLKPLLVSGQEVSVDTKQIESLINEWNFANNSRSTETFTKVYADHLLFYTERFTRSRAIEHKEKLFRANPDFRQKVGSKITYTPYTSGVVKCDFTKDVREFTKWRSYASYLLVSYERGGYRIVGESDYLTDKRLKYHLRIGEPISLQATRRKSIEKQDTSYRIDLTDETDSVFPAEDPIAGTRPDTLIASGTDPEQIASSFSGVFSDEVVTIRKDHLFILTAILLVGGVMIFIADSLRDRRAMDSRSKKVNKGDEYVQHLKDQARFQEFVLLLFDPLYFKIRKRKREKVLAGPVPDAEIQPDLELEFNHKEGRARFAIQCIYRADAGKDRIQLLSSRLLNGCRQFEAVYETDVYFIIGFGGKPDDPRDLFLIPASDITGEVVNLEALGAYRKSGMFFYNSVIGKLQ